MCALPNELVNEDAGMREGVRAIRQDNKSQAQTYANPNSNKENKKLKKIGCGTW